MNIFFIRLAFWIFMLPMTTYIVAERAFFARDAAMKSGKKLYQDSQSKYWDISGSGPDNIYAVGEGGNADFWDGDECFYLDSIYYPEITYKKVWTDGTQVIITGYSNNTAYVMRGK